MRTLLGFIGLIAISLILYFTLALASAFATWFATSIFGWATIPAVAWLIVNIARAAFGKGN